MGYNRMLGGDRISALEYGTKRCPKCGGDLVVREGRNGKSEGVEDILTVMGHYHMIPSAI